MKAGKKATKKHANKEKSQQGRTKPSRQISKTRAKARKPIITETNKATKQ